MTASDFAGFRANQQLAARTGAPSTPGSLWEGEVTIAPTGSATRATVRAVNQATGDQMTLGTASWPAPAGKALPAVGDKCLVAIDETQQAWIVSWVKPSWGVGVVDVTEPLLFNPPKRDSGAAATVTVLPGEYVQSGREPGPTFIVPDPTLALEGQVISILYYGTKTATIETVAKISGVFYGSGYRGGNKAVVLDPGDLFVATCQGGVWLLVGPEKAATQRIVSGTTIAATVPEPRDGQEINYQNAAMANKGIMWKFRYNAGSGSSYKWEFDGGAPLRNEVEVEEAIGGAKWQATGQGPRCNAPLNGEYFVTFGAQANQQPTVAFLWFMGLYIETYAGVVREALIGDSSSGGASYAATFYHSSGQYPITGGHLVECQYGVLGFGMTIKQRSLEIIPARAA